MSSKRDYYEVLGVGKTAGDDEIKKAYRQAALKFHPDRNPDDPEAEAKFKEASEAYEVLRDPDKRRRYDQFGHEGLGASGFHGFDHTEDIFSAFGDIFSEFFGFGMGGRSRGPRPQPGNDLRYNLTISFRDAAKGSEVTLKIPKNQTCGDCEGTGAAKGTSPETCKHCGGSGRLIQQQGFFRIQVACPVCHGQGSVIKEVCPTCKGRGQVMETKELTVRIPAGVDDGSRLRLRGEGEAGLYGGPPGDLYVVMSVEDDKVFRRQGQDLVYTLEISMIQAALGASIEIPTLDEPILFEVGKGTQPGEVLKLKGRGLPHIGSSSKGDLLIEVRVKIPTSITSKQEELLREFVRIEEDRPMTKVKEFIKKAGKAMGV